MFCNNCGNQIPDNAKFCTSCGSKTEAAEKPVTQANIPRKPTQPPLPPKPVQTTSVPPKPVAPVMPPKPVQTPIPPKPIQPQQSIQPQVQSQPIQPQPIQYQQPIQPQPIPRQQPVQPQPIQPQQPIQSQYQQPVQQPYQQYAQQPVATNKKKSVVPIISVFAIVIVAILAIFAYGYMQSTPEASVMKYCIGIIDKDGAKVLDNIYIPNTATQQEKDDFVKSVEQLDTNKMDRNSIKVFSTKPAAFRGTLSSQVEVNGKYTKDFKTIYVESKRDGKINLSAFYMIKQGKSFIIFDKWVVNSSTTSTASSVSGVKLSKTKATVSVKKSITLKATVSPANATDKSVTWKSSDTNYATVSSSGKVTGKKKGSVTITVTTNDGAYSASCKVTVAQPVKSVKLNKKSITIRKGKTYKLKATVLPTNANNKKVTWKSSKKRIATVSSKGVVKGIRKGTAYITVVTKDGKKTARCKVTIK